MPAQIMITKSDLYCLSFVTSLYCTWEQWQRNWEIQYPSQKVRDISGTTAKPVYTAGPRSKQKDRRVQGSPLQATRHLAIFFALVDPIIHFCSSFPLTHQITRTSHPQVKTQWHSDRQQPHTDIIEQLFLHQALPRILHRGTGATLAFSKNQLLYPYFATKILLLTVRLTIKSLTALRKQQQNSCLLWVNFLIM